MIRQTHKIFIVLLFLFLIVLTIFLVQLFLQEKINSPEHPSTPTVSTKTDFLVDIPQKTFLNNYLIVSAQTTPGTRCELLYVPPSGEEQNMDVIADDNGRCVWKWKITESDGKGSGRLIFTINGKSETHFIEIRSSL